MSISMLSPMMSPPPAAAAETDAGAAHRSLLHSTARTHTSISHTPRKHAMQTSGGVMTPSGRFVAPSQASSRRAADRFVPARGGECNPALRAQVAALAANKRAPDADWDEQVEDRENIEPLQMDMPVQSAVAGAAAQAAAMERAARVQLLGNTLMDLQRAGRTASTSTIAATAPLPNPLLVVHAPAAAAASGAFVSPSPAPRQANERFLAPATVRSGSSRSSGGFGGGAHPMSALNFASSPLASPRSRSQQQQQGQPRRRASEGVSSTHVPRSFAKQILSTPHASSAPVSSMTSPATAAAAAGGSGSSRTRASLGAPSAAAQQSPSLLLFGRSAQEEAEERIAAAADAARRDSDAFESAAAAAQVEEAQAAAMWSAQLRLQQEDASSASAMQSPVAPDAYTAATTPAAPSSSAFGPTSFHTPLPAASVSSALASTAAALTRSANKRSALHSAALSATAAAAATPTRASAAAAGGASFATPVSSSFTPLHFPPHLAHSVSRAARQLQTQGTMSARHMR